MTMTDKDKTDTDHIDLEKIQATLRAIHARLLQQPQLDHVAKAIEEAISHSKIAQARQILHNLTPGRPSRLSPAATEIAAFFPHTRHNANPYLRCNG